MPCWQSMVTVSQSAFATAWRQRGLIASQASALPPSAQNLFKEFGSLPWVLSAERERRTENGAPLPDLWGEN